MLRAVACLPLQNSYMNNRKINIQGSRENRIIGDVRYNDNCEAIVIFAHGYKGFKDWGAWNLVADRFVENDIAFAKFNFSYNGGTPDNPIDFPDLESFSENNYSTELNDLIEMIEYVNESDDLRDCTDLIILIGHSRGGGICHLAASHKAINGIITWAAVSDFGSRFPSGEDLVRWKNDGVYYVKNSRTNQEMPHKYQFYEDYQNNKGLLDIIQAAGAHNKPTYIIHGKKDLSVDYTEAMNIFNACSNAELLLLNDADHTFGSYHPYDKETLPADLQEISDSSIAFIKEMFHL